MEKLIEELQEEIELLKNRVYELENRQSCTEALIEFDVVRNGKTKYVYLPLTLSKIDGNVTWCITENVDFSGSDETKSSKYIYSSFQTSCPNLKYAVGWLDRNSDTMKSGFISFNEEGEVEVFYPVDHKDGDGLVLQKTCGVYPSQ